MASREEEYEFDGALHVNHRGVALTPAFEFEVSHFFRHFGVLLAYVADGIGRVARVVPGDCHGHVYQGHSGRRLVRLPDLNDILAEERGQLRGYVICSGGRHVTRYLSHSSELLEPISLHVPAGLEQS